MKALQVEANKGLLSLEDLPRPEVNTATITHITIPNYKMIKKVIFDFFKNQVRAEDDVIIKVGFAGLCGTDLHIVSV